MLIRKPWRSLIILLLLLLPQTVWAQSREKDYLRQDSARFRIYFCPEDARLVKSFWPVLRERIPQVEQRLGLALADTVAFVIAPNEKEWFRLTAGAPLWANGLAFPERGVAILKAPRFGLPYGPLPVTAVHEYVHLLLRAGAPQADIPRWLDEGLAQLLAGQRDYIESAVVARAAAARRLHSFYRLENLMAMPALEARQGYAEAVLAVELLEKRYGMAGLSNLVHELRRGRPFEEAFRLVFGKSVAAFESEFVAHVELTLRPALLADLDLWIGIAFVVLLALAGLAVWWRKRATLARWREQEQTTTSGGDSVPPYTVNYTLVRGRLHEPEDEDKRNMPPHDPHLPGN